MTSDATDAPTPFHIWVDAYARGGRIIRGHWRPRSGYADDARAWAEDHAIPGPVVDPLGEPEPTIDERDLPRPQPQRGGQLPPVMGSSVTSDEPPIGEILAQLGVDRSEGRRWRRSGRHPALRWSQRFADV